MSSASSYTDASAAASSDKLIISANIASVKQRMEYAIAANDREAGSVRLVAVSKTKPLELLVAAYEVSSTRGA